MISKIMMFAMSIASRGLTNKKTDLNTKRLRYLSCYGDKDIPSCKNLLKSEKSNFYYCGGCGCGDHPHTWLQKDKNEYSKLDYPSLNCPLKMPGFTNYDPNTPKDAGDRKKQIESYDIEKLKFIDITVSADKEKEQIFEKLSKIIKNT